MAVGDSAGGWTDLLADLRAVLCFAALLEVDFLAILRAFGLAARLTDFDFFTVLRGFDFAVALLRGFVLVEDLRDRAFPARFLGFAIARLLP
jgi:hypothetical protein